jgi:TonB-dependent Receptor Plug Domain
VQGKDMAETAVGTNILVALQGRVPGLRVVELVDNAGFQKLVITLRGGVTGGGLQGKATPPLVLVDGVPFDDVNQIAAIPASRVDRVEIVQRAEAFLGLRGYTGAIAIFTKKKSNEEISGYENDPNFVKVFVKGITEVPSVQTESPTLWLPELPLQPFSSTAFKLPKPKEAGVYAVQTEGVDYKGNNIKLLHFVKIKP